MNLMHYRRKLADLLIRGAYRLDPNRPQVTDSLSGYRITMGTMSLPRITPDMVNDVRPSVPPSDIGHR